MEYIFKLKLLSQKKKEDDSLLIEAYNPSTKKKYRCRIYQKCIQKMQEWKNTFHTIYRLHKLINEVLIDKKHTFKIEGTRQLSLKFSICQPQMRFSLLLHRRQQFKVPSFDIHKLPLLGKTEDTSSGYMDRNIHKKVILPPLPPLRSQKNKIVSQPIRVFISHCWDLDLEQRDNHSRVQQINYLLRKNQMITTWFDEHSLRGDITSGICQGIDNCDVFLICLTRKYIEKCHQSLDNYCKMELNYIKSRKGTTRMIPIIMEKDCLDTKLWGGPVGAYLNTKLYYNFSETNNYQAIDKLLGEIHRLYHHN